jgi:hypothetical protein
MKAFSSTPWTKDSVVGSDLRTYLLALVLIQLSLTLGGVILINLDQSFLVFMFVLLVFELSFNDLNMGEKSL